MNFKLQLYVGCYFVFTVNTVANKTVNTLIFFSGFVEAIWPTMRMT